MLEAQTFIVRLYRRHGTARRALTGVVEIVAERRVVAFRGIHALHAILVDPVANRATAGRVPTRPTTRSTEGESEK